MDKMTSPSNDGNKENSLGSKIRELIGIYFIVEYMLLNTILPIGVHENIKSLPPRYSYDQREKQVRDLFANDPYLSSKLGDAILAATLPGRYISYTIEHCLNNKQQ